MARPPAQSPAPAPALAGLLLAAGESRRFGGIKALAVWDGGTLVALAAQRLLATCPAGVVVVTGAHREEILAALAGLPLREQHHPGWAAGMGSSIAAAVPALPPADGVLILPCDLPAVTVADLRRLIGAWTAEPGRVALATFAGTEGPPAIFPRAVWPRLAALEGDHGARSLAGSSGPPLRVPLEAAALDVDTPGDLAGR